MSKRISRSERRQARAATLGRVAEAASFSPVKKRRASKTKRSATRAFLMASAAMAALALILVATPKSARAAGVDAPEIDPGSMVAALTLLSGAALTLSDRARRARLA